MTPHKLQVFFGVHRANDWVTSEDLIGHAIAIRTIRKHLLDLCKEGFLLRVKSFGGYRYRVKPDANLDYIKQWAQVYGYHQAV